jgi:anti-sigma B factor antagonist
MAPSEESGRGRSQGRCALELQIATRRVGEVTILDVSGELDLYTVPRLDEGLRGATGTPRPRLVVNLTAVAYVDSTALKVLTDHQKRVRDRGGEIVLVANQPTIIKIFKITGLDEVLPTVATEGEAIEKMRTIPPPQP